MRAEHGTAHLTCGSKRPLLIELSARHLSRLVDQSAESNDMKGIDIMGSFGHCGDRTYRSVYTSNTISEAPHGC